MSQFENLKIKSLPKNQCSLCETLRTMTQSSKALNFNTYYS